MCDALPTFSSHIILLRVGNIKQKQQTPLKSLILHFYFRVRKKHLLLEILSITHLDNFPLFKAFFDLVFQKLFLLHKSVFEYKNNF